MTACGEVFGSKSQSLAWLQSNLPVSIEPGAENDATKLQNLRQEAKLLKEELQKEIEANSNLHKEAIEGRKRSNEICAMMTIIRSETEGVIQRHNQIIEMNEDEQMEGRGGDVHYEEDEHVTGNSTGSGASGDTAIAAEDEKVKVVSDAIPGASATTVSASTSASAPTDADMEAEEGEIEDEDNAFGEKNDRDGPVLEVIVPSQDNESGGSTVSADQQLGVSSASNQKRGYANEEDDVDPDKKRRKV